METVIAVPRSGGSTAAFSRGLISSEYQSKQILILLCNWSEPGIVWRGLVPLLLQSNKGTAKRALICLLDFLKATVETKHGLELSLLLENLKVYRRELGTSQRFNGTTTRNKPEHMVLWIQPPTSTYYHSYFTRILNAWEHRMILYISTAAWFSTLGGGHFFCRNLKTAVALAWKQRRVALLMGDYAMAYKCTINEAYSYIYSGKFAMALKTIDSVALLNRRLDIHPLDTVIVNMCNSAKLFCKRVRKASRKLKTSKTQQQALNCDDYQRIRVVEDQSAARLERVK